MGELLLLSYFPMLAEKSGVNNSAGSAGGHRNAHVHDRVVGEFGNLSGVIEIIIFAEGKAAVEDDVFIWIEGIGIDEQRRVMIGWKGGFADCDAVLIPGKRKLLGNLREKLVAAGIAEKNEIMRSNVRIAYF